jgi:LCP family protein required for cell wall assembly
VSYYQPSDPTLASAGVPAPAGRGGRTWWQRLVITAGVLATVMCLLSAGVVAWGWSKFANITQIDLALAEASGPPRNWLLVGTDSREGIDPDDPNAAVFQAEPVAGKRTDTMMVARVDPARDRVDLLSIPRDLWVPLAGTGDNGRINSAFNGEGGQQRLIDTIETYFGFEIHHYAEVNFVGFQDVIDALGGIPIWFDTPMRDHGSGLHIDAAGCHVLDGFQALAYARARQLEYFEDGQWRTDGTGDLGRMSRQQHFVRRVVDTVRSRFNVTDIATIDHVFEVAGRNLVIDRGVGPRELLGLGRNFASFEGDRIVGHALPVVARTTNGGADVLDLQVAEAQPILDVFRGVPPEPVPASEVSVVVVNGSGVSGQARQVTDALAAAGFGVGPPETAAEPVAATEVRFAPGLLAHADRVARQLSAYPLLVEDPAVAGVVLVTGPDLGSVRDRPVAFDQAAFDALAPATAGPAPADPPPPAGPASAPAEAPPPAEPVGRLPGPTPEGTACA